MGCVSQEVHSQKQESVALNAQIKKLQSELRFVYSEMNAASLEATAVSTLFAFLKDFAFLLRLAQRELDRATAESERCAVTLGDLRLSCASLERDLQQKKAHRDDVALTQNFRSLEVKSARPGGASRALWPASQLASPPSTRGQGCPGRSGHSLARGVGGRRYCCL